MCKMQTLVYSSSTPYYDAPGVVFLNPRKDSLDSNSTRVVFNSDFYNKANKHQYQIHEMTLYSDFK